MSSDVKSWRSNRHSLTALARVVAAFLLVLAGLLGITRPALAADGEFVNISTRSFVGTGDEVMIGGFIIEGGARQVLIQARGPELASAGVANALADPILRVIDTSDPANVRELMFNDNWEDSQGQLVSDLWGGSPNLAAGSLSSAAVLTLEPGNYTAIVEGKNGTAGVAIVEVYEIDLDGADGKFVNLSTRSFVGTGDEVMIGGFIIEDGPRHVAIHALGPELANRGVSNVLADPVLTVVEITNPGNPLLINDDWEDSQGELLADLWGPGLSFTAGSKSSAAVLTLEPGNYTATVEGKDGTTGIALVEVLRIDSPDAGSPDREALMALYNATDGTNWTNSDNWLSDAPLDQWYGVTIDESGRVIELDLDDNRLSGSIPAQLGNLTNLRLLWLAGNQLSGSIPPEFGNLANLLDLDLDDNRLSGSIPAQLGNLANLRVMWLAGNQLSGSIPSQLGNLSNLQSLDLSNNQLSGVIPSVLGNLANLETLGLRDNRLSGTIPSELGRLANLEGILLGGSNQFSGCIPSGLQGVMESDLSTLGLSYCGSIPNDRAALVAFYDATDGPNWLNNGNWLTAAPLDEWHGVRTDPTTGRVLGLRLYRNGLRGEIPTELISLSNLEGLYLSQNNLTGPIPAGLEGLADLTNLELGSNELTGEIPPEIGDLSLLSYLDLSTNNLSGSIPPEFGNLRNLEVLLLHGNKLTGSIPADLGGMTSLLGLFLNGNRLEGVIPKTFLGLEHLGSFEFYGNQGLCAPGTPEFVEWSQDVERRPSHGRIGSSYAGPFCSESDRIVLERLFETADGENWTRSDMWLATDVLEEWYGVSTDSLGRVTMLNLTDNGLAGGLPINLGNLANMGEMRIAMNGGLTGRLPASLTQLSLHTFHYTGTGLCVPASPRFRVWLSSIQSHEGTNTECPPLSDREILEALYHATGGPSWTRDENWLTDAPLAEWYGVESDGQDEVLGLRMRENNLEGVMPAELGDLASLRELDFTQNNLRGEIPGVLGDLASLQILLLESNDLTGGIPPEFGNLANLTRMRLGGNRLAGPIPPELGNLINLQELNTWGNDLSGSIPPELGRLAKLRRLSLPNNDLSDLIPPELGDLGSLQVLYLVGNNLSGSIPPELGKLSSLQQLYLAENDLTGSIPPELGGLANLRDMVLAVNNLSGSIPPELGKLGSLNYLNLVNNQLSGQIPGELGSLSAVEVVLLASNNLSGSVPPGFGRMSSLKELSLANNPVMEGPLPLELTALGRLEALFAGDTNLCAPSAEGFTAWLQRVPRTRISTCFEGAPPAAYLTQAVQSWEFPVPLVAGERALLRVFLTANSATGEGFPLVRARFYHDGREVHAEDIPGKSDPIPTEVDEKSLSKSANVEVPGHLIQPGLEMVIEVDPDGTLDSTLGVAKRIPAEGRMAVDVEAMPLLDLTLIPFIRTETEDSSIVNLIEAMAANPDNHEMLWDTRTLLPISDLRVTAHEPVQSTSNNAFDLLAQTEAIRTMEGGTGHYMGMMDSPVTGAAGVAPVSGRWSFSIPDSDTMAHELGHNLSLRHAPCGPVGGSSDPSYPHPNGSIGVWGYDFRDGGHLVQPSTPDLMSYCHPRWIGDYGFTNALRYRLFEEGAPAESTAIAATTKSLLLWGGIGAQSGPYLEPAFVVEAPSRLPDSAGEYAITGRSDKAAELFRLTFTIPEVAHGDGSSSFAFALPVRQEWEASLATITLSGPEGTVTLDNDSNLPMTILRNPRTRQVRAILCDSPLGAEARVSTDGTAEAPEDKAEQSTTGFEVLFSRGIPDAASWRQ